MTYITIKSKSQNLFLQLQYNRNLKFDGQGIGMYAWELSEILVIHMKNWIRWLYPKADDLEVLVQSDSASIYRTTNEPIL